MNKLMRPLFLLYKTNQTRYYNTSLVFLSQKPRISLNVKPCYYFLENNKNKDSHIKLPNEKEENKDSLQQILDTITLQTTEVKTIQSTIEKNTNPFTITCYSVAIVMTVLIACYKIFITKEVSDLKKQYKQIEKQMNENFKDSRNILNQINKEIVKISTKLDMMTENKYQDY